MDKKINEAESTGVSRRGLLRGAAVAAGAAAVLAGTVLPAEAKMAQKAAGYVDTTKDGKTCSTCNLFKAPSSCSLVDGTISPNGTCRFYSKKS